MSEKKPVVEFVKALAKVQSKLSSPKRGSVNPFFKSKYADLESVWEACRDELSKNGFAVVQGVDSQPDGEYLCSILMHEGGHEISFKMKLIITKKDMQGLGSAITYARRYQILSMVGLTPSDDDGNAACEKPKVNNSKKPQSTSSVDREGIYKGDPEDYVMTFGKEYTGKGILDFPEEKMVSWINYVIDTHNKRGGPMSVAARDLLNQFSLLYPDYEVWSKVL